MYHEFSCILGRLCLWDGKVPVLLAVSGGMDSICMADLFRRTGLEFAVAHCNFHLRGDDSDADEALVREWAGAAGVKFHRTGFDTARFAKEHNVSIEMAARELRYRWFSHLCKDEGYPVLCVAHNANDNAETLFLNILRGTGIHGLSGMPYESEVPYSGEDGSPVRLVRPLLSFTRKQIEGYVRSHSLSYREDRTNALTDYRRNRIRHLVFPVFEKMNPSFVRTVSGEMAHFAQAEALADSCADGLLSLITEKKGGDTVLDIGKLVESGHWEYVLYRFLGRFGFNRASVTALTDLLKSDRTLSGKSFNAPGYTLVTTGHKLIVRPVSQSACPDSGSGTAAVVRCPGEYVCNGVRFSVSVEDRSSMTTLRQPAGTLIFDAGLLRFPFVCRPWQDGDWFVPFGMSGRKKVSDFFTDLKYDIFRKRKAVMLVGTSRQDRDERRIAAVLGERIDDSYKVTQDTVSVLKVALEQSI